MTPRDFPKMKDGEWVQPTRNGFRMGCCDCGLVHRLDFVVVRYAKGKRVKIFFRAFRDNPSTKKLRKRHNIRVRTK